MKHGVHASRTHSSRRSRLAKFGTLVVSAGMVAGVVVAAAPPASAAPGWSAIPSVSPADSNGTTVSGVACPATNSCFAVGRYATATGASTLAEHFNGNTWGRLPSANPSTMSSLLAVACPSKRNCFAVGNYVVGSSTRGLVEHWNGVTWGTLPSVFPSGATAAGLSGIACPSDRSCFAVGRYAVSSGIRTFVEHWNGNAWGMLPSFNPSSSALFNAVACPSLRSCFAVGSYTAGGATRTLTEHWNGVNWGQLPSVNPGGSTNASFNGVSCPAVRVCFAVGSYAAGATNRNLVEQWNGSRWTPLASVTAPGAFATNFSGVTCPTTGSCFAVGLYSAASGTRTLVEHWNGHTWGIMPSTSPGSIVNHLYGVACATKANCFAVGDYTKTFPGRGLILRYP